MKRINITKKKSNISEPLNENQYPNFIGSWDLESEALCTEIIKLFEENKNLQKQGATELGKNVAIKKITGITVSPNDLKDIKFKCLNSYINELYKCYSDYQNQWPFLKVLIKNINIRSFNIQKYSPSDNFSKIHTERSSLEHSHRVFAWMTYLNDVNDGGETYYPHYDIKVKPELGKTLIWPAEWTHAHVGEILNSGVKYIVTGWMHFPYDNNL